MIGKTNFLKSFVLIVLAFFFVCLIIYAPYFLVYSTTPLNSDTIILFKGPDYLSRKLQVQELIAKGFANYVIWPAEDRRQGLQKKKENFNPDRLIYPNKWQISGDFNVLSEMRYFEYTHIELIKAKNIMDSSRWQSAIIVSSPYHMRRIKLISDQVFKSASYRLSYVPTRFESPRPGSWFLRKYDIQWVLQEYIKIIWFYIYDHFTAY